MINAWSLLWEELNGTMDETYPVREYVDGHGDVHSAPVDDLLVPVDDVYAYHYPPTSPLSDDPYPTVGSLEYYKRPDLAQDIDLSDNDDQAAHHFNLEKEVDRVELRLNSEVQQSDNMSAHYFKYHEDEILKDIESYVSGTYRGHYTGTTHEYRNVQTLDLMAARELASSFCQANILKYGSRYGSKDGKNKKDLMKVIHYAMLLLHFDEHYGKPSMTSGNIDHNMP